MRSVESGWHQKTRLPFTRRLTNWPIGRRAAATTLRCYFSNRFAELCPIRIHRAVQPDPFETPSDGPVIATIAAIAAASGLRIQSTLTLTLFSAALARPTLRMGS